MFKKPWFFALWAVFAFWAWAFHVATGFLNGLIAAESGKRSGIIAMINGVTEMLLVGPLGRPVTVIVLVLAGVGSAIWIYKFSSMRRTAANGQ